MKNFVVEYLVIPVLTVYEVIRGCVIGIKLGWLWGMGKSEEEFYDRIRKYVYGDEE